jgi:PAS domain S-box-containing protein
MALDEGVFTLSRLTDRLAKAEIYQSIQTDVAETLIATTTMRDAMPRVLRAIGTSLNWQIGFYWERSSIAPFCLVVKAMWQSPKLDATNFMERSKELSFCPGESMPGRVWASATPAWFTNFDELGFVRSDFAKEAGIKAALAFPIYSDLEIIGVVEFFSTNNSEQPDNNLLDVLINVGYRVGQFYKMRELDRKLREADSRYRVLIDSAHSAVVVADYEGSITEWNTTAEELFGWKRDEIIGRNLEIIIPERYREAHHAGLKRVTDHDHTFGSRVIGKLVTMEGRTKNGTEIPVDIALSTWNTTGHRFFGAIIKKHGN